MPKGHYKCLFITDSRSDGVGNNGSDLNNMLNSLFLDLSTLDNIYWLLDMNDEDLRHLHHPSSQISISFSIKVWLYPLIPAWAAEDINSAAFSFIFSHVPLCVIYAFIGIVKHCQGLLKFSFSSANRTQSFFFFFFALLCHKVTIKVENQFMDFLLVWESSCLSEWQEKRLERLEIMRDVLRK